MNRNAIIFVLASLAVLLLWNRLIDHYAPLPVAPAAAVSGAASPQTATATVDSAAAFSSAPRGQARPAPAAAAEPSLRTAAGQRVRVQTAVFNAELDSQGARFSSLQLKGVSTLGAVKGPLNLVPPRDLERYGALELQGTSLDSMVWTLLTPQPLKQDGLQRVRFSAVLPGTGLEFVKTFSFPPSGHAVDVEIDVHNRGGSLRNFLSPLSLVWGPDLGGAGGGMRGRGRAGVVQLEDRVERQSAGKKQAVFDYASPRWVALKNTYFVVGLFPGAGSPWTRAELREQGSDSQGLAHMSVALQAENLSLAPGKSLVLKARLWAGPQEYQTLKSVGDNFQAVVQFQDWSWLAWLNPVCVWLLYLLKWFHAVTGNWGVAVILLTLLVRGMLFYPSMKSMVNMRHMQKKQAVMKPRLDTLKKTYKDNPSKLNEETMKLYKEFGVNPLGGCLPMFIQLPVFFALYDTLAAAYELRGAGFCWRWTNLSAADPTYIFPLAMGVSQFLQQRMTPTAAAGTDEQIQMQKTMQWMMPVGFTVMAIWMKWPLGLMLYWTASNVMGVFQQVVVNRVVDSGKA